MIKKIFSIITLSLIMASFSFAGVEDELKKINQSLKEIDKRLTAIEKKVNTPAQNNNKKQVQADPNKVYNIPISGSVVLGNPNAKITITEFTDFQ
jgi:protein-disulfide isomerase